MQEISMIYISHIVVMDIPAKGHDKTGLFGGRLTLYHKIPSFNDPKEKNFWTHCGRRRKSW